MKKYQKVERADILSPQEHDTVEQELRKVGKTSMRNLDEDERKQVTDALADDANSTSS